MPLTFIVKMVTANAEANISAGSLYDSSDAGRRPKRKAQPWH